jgi:xanthine dehydrogenase accessory factor
MSGDSWAWLEKAGELARAGRPFALVTVIQVRGSAPRGAGAKLIVEADGTFYGTVGGGHLEEAVLEDARKALMEAQSRPRQYPLCLRTGQCCGGAVETFTEIIGVGPHLYLFGAGHVGQSLAQTLAGTPFTVHTIDPRPEWGGSASLPAGVIKHVCDWRSFVATAPWDRQRTYVAVMTHDHALDLEIIADVVVRPARFIGLIGSTTKWDRFRHRLAAQGVAPDELARVRCPIGIGALGKAPREVAVSIAAQLLALHHDAVEPVVAPHG